MGFRNRFQRLLATVALTLSALTATQHGIAAGLMAPVDSNLPPLQIREQHVTAVSYTHLTLPTICSV